MTDPEFLHYQLAFFTPGIRPLWASSLNAILDSLNFLIYPRGRPVTVQRL